MKVVDIPIEQIKPNDYNPNILEDKLLLQLQKTIQSYGFLQPIVVVKSKNEETYTIVDGEHRYNSCVALNYSTAPCVIVDFDKFGAMIQTISMNRLRGSLDAIKMAEVVSFLRKTYSFEELADQLGLETDDLKTYDELSSLDLENIDALHGADIQDNDILEDINFFKLSLDNATYALLKECLDKEGVETKVAFVNICRRFLEENFPQVLLDIAERGKQLDIEEGIEETADSEEAQE